VYDPRYFAVHHFNPGVESLDNEDRNPLSVNFNNLKTNFGANGVDLDSVTYTYEEASGVDIKIPSRYQDAHTEGSTKEPVTLLTGTFVFEDATYDYDSKKPPIMSSQYWNLEKQRTGKLLPYRYEFLTMTIPADIGETIVIDRIVDEVVSVDLVTRNVRDKLIVTNRGVGYNAGDTVGIQALNIELKVLTTAPNGSILTLLVLNNGENLPLSFCMPNSITIGSLKPKHKVTTIALIAGSTGKDFDAYFVCAEVRKKTKCDPKPFLIKQGGNEIVRIAANFAGPTHKETGRSTEAEAESYINQPGEATFDLSVGNVKSADSTYDIFFHFHNDITMTWLACGAVQGENGQPHGDSKNPAESEEQHVTIESIKLT
jgi:hypothetical protein